MYFFGGSCAAPTLSFYSFWRRLSIHKVEIWMNYTTGCSFDCASCLCNIGRKSAICPYNFRERNTTPLQGAERVCAGAAFPFHAGIFRPRRRPDACAPGRHPAPDPGTEGGSPARRTGRSVHLHRRFPAGLDIPPALRYDEHNGSTAQSTPDGTSAPSALCGIAAIQKGRGLL